ncbi:MAG: hypothetical protein VB948_08325 [Pseudomonadales bacterium]|jgi:hypothetical protein
MAPATRCFTAVAGLLLFWPLFGSATDVFVGPLAVEPFNFPSPALGIGIRQGVDGLVVEAVYGPRRSLQTVELDRWVQFHLPPHTSFWVQLNPAR